jgi:D-glycero-alpha-D-manno-heptose-7-phosphate kinase
MHFDKEQHTIEEDVSIKSALLKIDANKDGVIFIQSEFGKIMGIATDGDIRRGLLAGMTLEDPISRCANSNFVSANLKTSRETLIKKLDGNIRVIPILDELGKLTNIVSRRNLPLENEKPIYIRARAPVRMSFGGGGSDLTHYFSEHSGAVINSAISLYSHATMKFRNDAKIIINSTDLNTELVANDLDSALSQESPLGLIQSLLSVIRPQYGFELHLNSDFSVGSGLGGSATLLAAVLGCFNLVRKDQWTQHELVEIAFQAERLQFGIAGGWQDQYASVFGGFNFIEFQPDQNIISPLLINPDVCLELEESLILCDTGIAHHSGKIHHEQKQTMLEKSIKKMVAENVKLSYDIRNHILRGELDKFGKCLNRSWMLKRNFSPLITNSQIDEIYNGAIENGASGGKLLGAGGGGYFVFYVPPFKKHKLTSYLKSKNLTLQPFRFEPSGLQAWSSRSNDKTTSEN